MSEAEYIPVYDDGTPMDAESAAADMAELEAESARPTIPPGAMDRGLPHSREAERALLGSMLLEKDMVGETFATLESAGGAEAFFHEHHQILYRVLSRLYFEDKIVDDVVLKDELVRDGLFEKLGGYEFLTGLASSVGSALRASHYAEVVIAHAHRRRLIGGCHRVMEAAFDQSEGVAALVERAEREIGSVSESAVKRAVRIGDIGARRLKEYESFTGELDGIPTGFVTLDAKLCGLHAGELTIIAASASMGKTAMALCIAANMAAAGMPVLFFSLEMSAATIFERLICMEADINILDWRSHRLDWKDRENVSIKAKAIAEWPLYLDDRAEHSIYSLNAASRLEVRKSKIKAVFVDYLQLMTAPGRRDDNRTAEVGRISRGLKALAKGLQIPVVAMAQLNRQIDARTGKSRRPRLSDLRESGTIEQDADVVALLHRDSYYTIREQAEGTDNGVAEVVIAKQRNGPVGTVKLGWEARCAKFTNDVPNEPTHAEQSTGETPPEPPEYGKQARYPWS